MRSRNHMAKNTTMAMPDDPVPPLSADFISKFHVMPYQVEAIQKSQGMMFENFWTDFINGEIPSSRLSALDINSLKLRRVLNRLEAAGTNPKLIGLSLGFFWIVGEEEWNLTI